MRSTLITNTNNSSNNASGGGDGINSANNAGPAVIQAPVPMSINTSLNGQHVGTSSNQPLSPTGSNFSFPGHPGLASSPLQTVTGGPIVGSVGAGIDRTMSPNTVGPQLRSMLPGSPLSLNITSPRNSIVEQLEE